MRTVLLGSVLAMLLVPPIRPQTAPAGLDPAGKWMFSTHDEDGSPLTATMEISGQPGKYHGEVTVEGADHKLPVTDVATSGNAFIAIATTDDGAAVVKVWKSVDGKLQSVWGPVKQIIPATVERAR